MTPTRLFISLLAPSVLACGGAPFSSIEAEHIIPDAGTTQEGGPTQEASTETSSETSLEGGADVAPACAHGDMRCDGNGVSACEQGQWGSPTACQGQTCINGACAGSCAPGQTRCQGNGYETCQEGSWSPPIACVNQACVNGACVGECIPGVTQCQSDTQVQTCSQEGQWATSTCPNACVGVSCGGVCVPQSTQGCTYFDPTTGMDQNGNQMCGSDGQWGTCG